MSTPFAQRRRTLQLQMAKRRVSSLLVTHPANWYYLTGFTGDSGILVISRQGSVLITDGRFLGQAREETSGVKVLPQEKSLLASAGRFLKAHGGSRVGFDSSRVTVEQFRALRKESGTRIRWIALPGTVESLRARKDAAEIAQMREAAILAGEVLQSVLKLLKPGVREIEIGAEIEYEMRRRGASGPAFETIVAFGKRSAPIMDALLEHMPVERTVVIDPQV
jgi:Xaa-Pro aminopeptidase